MKEEEYLVARLSPQASQVLLALVLASQAGIRGVVSKQAEFAIHITNLSGSHPEALFELESYSLIQIVTQMNHPLQVRLTLSMKEYESEIRTDKASPHSPGTGEKTALEQDDVVENAPLSVGRSSGQNGLRGNGQKGPELVAEHRLDPMERCRLADQSGDKQAQIKALREVWNEVFPESEYPFQRLSNDAAINFLANGRTAESVATVIYQATQQATNRIEYPRAYIEKALASADKKRAAIEEEVGGGEIITDELRRLVELGRRQFARGSSNKA